MVLYKGYNYFFPGKSIVHDEDLERAHQERLAEEAAKTTETLLDRIEKIERRLDQLENSDLDYN
tara:strand:+ start:4410 stop:4601 length:192 start_codon:yes stop_codon:yes gene_type:complete